ncbi:MAG TPA: 7TM diverse intracellular signaling domain-containing protein [Oligoflexus sp.]|uniref:sensor histidine kinase n=1 Tax=Oligoflexus sp. TaxID=1971216 RepID=UPI002D4A8578|nr:7TM diverse intracellular signaling domain-containing protein [Oligoflexus sp.]HYX31662.1 7TM diverse intracellular signaling domain-containing protein [Oligoflexus sp.]
MTLRLVLIVLALLGAARLPDAAAMSLNATMSRQPVPSVEVFPSEAGTDEEILTRIGESPGEAISHGDKLGGAFQIIWLRFEIQNSTAEDFERIIYLPNNFSAPHFDFYFYRNGAFVEHRSYRRDDFETGDMIIGRSSYATFHFPKATSTIVYIKIQTGYEQLNQNFQIATRQQFNNWEVLSTFFVGLFLGIMFLAVLYNLMQAAAYRDRTFLWYSAYCASIMTIAMSYYGIWVRMFSMWETQKYLSYVGGMLTLVTGTFFMRPLLDTRRLSPYLDKIFMAVPCIAVFTMALRLIPSTSYQGFVLHSLNTMLFVSLACWAGVNAMLRGKELAWLYTSSFLFIAISVVYVRLSQMNIVPISPSAFYAPAVGHVMQIIFISYAMFIRSRRAYTEMLKSHRNHSINERLNLLLKIISHDIANPLQAISLYCNMALTKVKGQKLPHKELEKALEAITMQTRIIRHAKEAVRQMQLGQKVQIQPVPVSEIIREVLQVFQPLCHDRDIRLEVVNEVRDDLVIHTDATILVHNIIGNILSNSIKFTPRSGLIQMQLRLVNRRLIFDLVDTGPGISKEKRVEIFTLNVGQGFNEQLTGAGSFGLSILQMCSELLNGELNIGPSTVTESGQEQGLRITVSLPLHHAL